MAHQETLTSIARRLRPAPERFAAAAALQDPSLLMEAQAARPPRERPARRQRRPIDGEMGAALLLVAAVALALVWSNSPWRGTYDAFWHAPIAVTVGPWTLAANLRTWIDEGLMTLFFLVVGLEAKRERDLGELRDGRRLTVPVLAGLAGMVASAAVYLAIHAAALVVAAALLASLLTIRAVAGRQFRAHGDSTALLTPLSVLIGIALWLALFQSGIDPVISGLLIGLLTNAYEPRPHGPAAISPNDRIQHQLHPWTSTVVVPIFALANAGLHLDGHLLSTAATSPVTWGIVLAYVVGKPLGIVVAGAVPRRRAALSIGELRRAALSTGVGFTVSLLIASRAFDGALLDQAKVGILATALLAPALAVAALAPLRAPMRRLPATACAA